MKLGSLLTKIIGEAAMTSFLEKWPQSNRGLGVNVIYERSILRLKILPTVFEEGFGVADNQEKVTGVLLNEVLRQPISYVIFPNRRN